MEPERGFEPANLPITSRLRYHCATRARTAARSTRPDNKTRLPCRRRPLGSIRTAFEQGQREAESAPRPTARLLHSRGRRRSEEKLGLGAGVATDDPRTRVTVQALRPGHLDEYLEFFETRAFTDNPRWADCYCYFPLHDPVEKAWKAHTGLENREAVSACILSGRSQGYLAYRNGEVVGWCSAGPRELYPMLRGEERPAADRVGAIFCFIVAPDHRGAGVARALLDAACDGLAAQGLAMAQARPLRDPSSAPNERGPLPMYLKAGFIVVDEYPDRTVLVQKPLGPSTQEPSAS